MLTKKKRKYSLFAIAMMTALLLVAVSLAACGDQKGGESSLPESSQTSQSEESSESSAPVESSQPEKATLTKEQAETLAKERIPYDFTNGYTLTLDTENMELDGKQYYRFSISDGESALESSVLVDKSDGTVKTYYPGGDTYLAEEDPFLQDNTSADWGGIFAADDGAKLLSTELIDNNSFEFTLTVTSNGTENTLEAKTARISGKKATYTGDNGFGLTFERTSEGITITTTGSTPGGESYDGSYLPDK